MRDRPPRLRRGDAAVDHLHDTIRTRGDARIVRHEQGMRPRELRSSSRSSSTRAPAAESRLPVGSSASAIGGSFASARARATRWRSPQRAPADDSARGPTSRPR